MVTKEIAGLMVEFNSPSVLHIVGLPVIVSYDGQQWWVSFRGRDYQFESRNSAIIFIRDHWSLGNAHSY